MSLADQRSTQRFISELVSQRGDSPSPTRQPFPHPHPHPQHPHPRPRNRHVSQGHRRTYSSPVPTAAVARGDVRARTMSGGAAGSMAATTGSMTAAAGSVAAAEGSVTVTAKTVAVTGGVTAVTATGSAPAVTETATTTTAMAMATTTMTMTATTATTQTTQTTATGSATVTTSMGSATAAGGATATTATAATTTVTATATTATGPPQPPSTVSGAQAGGSRRVELPLMAARANDEAMGIGESERTSAGVEALEGRLGLTPPPAEGKQQRGRRGLIGPGGILQKLASHRSLSKLRGSHPDLADADADADPEKPPAMVIHTLPPSPRNHAPPEHTPLSATTPTSATAFLRPAPPPPPHATSRWARPVVFAPSSALTPSPSPSRRSLQPSFEYAPPSGRITSRSHRSPRAPRTHPPEPAVEMVEIPRFKKRELNLGIVRKSAVAQRAVWLALGGLWLINGLLSLFFDVNVMYILVQCTIHPSFESNSQKTWQFATAAYVVLWALSTFAVWLGWELWYEFWRRWRLPRPAIEPIYLSLPASLLLSLKSYNHFLFLLHIRTSPLGTPHARDIIPETCYALIQLLPGLIPLIPRAAIAVVVLVSFWAAPAPDVQTPYGGTLDHTSDRDPSFFRADTPGELTPYAKAVLMAFTVYIAFRLLVVLASAAGLWIFSRRPLGGLFARPFRLPGTTPSTPSAPSKRKHRRADTGPRDPNLTHSPQKSWVDHENAFDWAWRERTRARVQDAFELCIVRFDVAGGTAGAGGEGAAAAGEAGETEMLDQVGADVHADPRKEHAYLAYYSAGEFSTQFGQGVQGKNESYSTRPTGPTPRAPRTPKMGSTRPESMLDPTATATAGGSEFLHPRPAATVVDSTSDLFYTPKSGNSPSSVGASRSAGDGRLVSAAACPATEAVTRDATGAVTGAGGAFAFKRPGAVTEFGVKDHGDDSQDGDGGRASEDSGEVGDESTGLLSSSAGASPRLGRSSVLARDRSASNASRLSRKLSGGVSNVSGTTGSGTRSSSSSLDASCTHARHVRRRASTTSHVHPLDLSPRGRSSSMTLLKESLSNAAVVSGTMGLVRRARSGTVSSAADGKQFRRMRGEEGEGEESEEELADDGSVTPRSDLDQTMGLGVPFGLTPGLGASPERRLTTMPAGTGTVAAWA